MDAQQQTDAQLHIQKCEYVIRKQMDVIKQQRAEIDRLVSWINGDRDALTCLQAVYNDPATSDGNRIKAAAAAVAYERPKVTVSVRVAGPAVLGDRLDGARTMKVINPPEVIEGSFSSQAQTSPA
jgi:hypothetical protein